MIKRFFFLVITAAFISSFLLLAGTAVLDRVNAARTESQIQALRLASSGINTDSPIEGQTTSLQQPSSAATEAALDAPAARTIAEVLADPQAFTDQYLTLTGSATLGQENSLTISDGTGDIRVAIASASVPLNSGEKLTITGQLTLADSGANLDACRVVNSQGMVIQLQSCDSAPAVSASGPSPDGNIAISKNTGTSGNPLPVAQLESPGSSITVADLINNPGAYFNQLLTLTGMVTLLDDDELLLNDGTGQIFVDFEDDQFATLPLSDGQMITISGYFENDGQYLDIDACEITTENGLTASVNGCGSSDDDHAGSSDDNTAYTGDDHDDDSSGSSNDNPAYDDSHDDDSEDKSSSSDDSRSDDDGDHEDEHEDDHDEEHDDHEDDNHDGGDHDDGGDHEDGGD